MIAVFGNPPMPGIFPFAAEKQGPVIYAGGSGIGAYPGMAGGNRIYTGIKSRAR